MANNSRSSNPGVVISVRGSVVDMRFDAQLPPIYSLLRAGEKNQIVIEVLAQLDAHRVRGIAFTPTQGLDRGMVVKDSGGPLQAPVGKASSRACSTCSAMPSTLKRRRQMCNGILCIGHRRRWCTVPPGLKCFRRASRSSMC